VEKPSRRRLKKVNTIAWLRLANKAKTTFILLGASHHQLSQIDCQKIRLGETDIIAIASEAMCLGDLLDSTLTFAPHVHRSG